MYYCPELGIFLSRDRLKKVGDYKYANNNPIMLVDPDGSEDEQVDPPRTPQPPSNVATAKGLELRQAKTSADLPASVAAQPGASIVEGVITVTYKCEGDEWTVVSVNDSSKVIVYVADVALIMQLIKPDNQNLADDALKVAASKVQGAVVNYEFDNYKILKEALDQAKARWEGDLLKLKANDPDELTTEILGKLMAWKKIIAQKSYPRKVSDSKKVGEKVPSEMEWEDIIKKRVTHQLKVQGANQ